MMYKFRLGLILLLILLLSACSTSPRTETIVMSGNDQTAIDRQSSQPFQVQKIYRIKEQLLDNGQLIGWASDNRLIAATSSRNILGKDSIHYLSPPYEKVTSISNLESTRSQTGVSPDGKYLYGSFSNSNHVTLSITSLATGKSKQITKLSAENNVFIQNISWSNNGKVLVYVLGYAKGGVKDNNVYIYDFSTQKLNHYEVNGLAKEGSILSADISDDQRSFILTIVRSNQSNKMYTALGTVSDGKINLKYDRQSYFAGNVWMSNDQFVFLGSDGTLYEYDQRNGELAIILEQVNSFSLSPDRKNIAYSLYNQNIIYVGKVQGKNIIYNEPIYRGIAVNEIKWSLDNSSLLVKGQKPNYTSSFNSNEGNDLESLVIKLK